MEAVRADFEGKFAPDDRPASLEFVHREIDALFQEDTQGGFDAFCGREPFQVPHLASGAREHGPVRAERIPVDEPPHRIKETGFPGPEPASEFGRSGRRVPWMSQRGGKPGQKTGAYPEVPPGNSRVRLPLECIPFPHVRRPSLSAIVHS